MGIRKISESDNTTYEKDIFAIDIHGNVSNIITRKEIFTIAEKEAKIANLQSRIDKEQSDLDAANAVE